MKEICICAAVKATTGEIIRCHRHSDGIRALTARGLELLKKPIGQGFITSNNRYVGRAEGMLLQKAAGIVSIRSTLEKQTSMFSDRILYSEDLY